MFRPLVIAVAALFSGCSGPPVDLAIQAPTTFAQEPDGHEEAVVTDVIDGDTIEVLVSGGADGPGRGAAIAGRSYRVRLTGIDTPETVRPGTPIECFGKEASAAATALLEGKEVRLVKDVEDQDRYDRLLRYVYLRDEMANARLVANGYAHAYTYPPNIRHSRLFVELERQARENDRGLWSPHACNGAP